MDSLSIIIDGVSGSGKSVFGLWLANAVDEFGHVSTLCDNRMRITHGKAKRAPVGGPLKRQARIEINVVQAGETASVRVADPIQMRINCPDCGALHIDEGEFATRPHHTHACQNCGAVWRPAVVHTVGVKFLPGFKNQEVAE